MDDFRDIESLPTVPEVRDDADMLAELLMARGVPLDVIAAVVESFDERRAMDATNHVQRCGLALLRKIAGALSDSALDNSIEGRALRIAISGSGDKTVEEHGKDFGKSKECFHYYVRKWREKLEF